MGKTALLQRTVTRRNLIEGGIAAGALVALGGTVKAFAGEGDLLRPPGAQDEQSLLSLCIRCDRCRSACPTNAIGVGHLSDGIILNAWRYVPLRLSNRLTSTSTR